MLHGLGDLFALLPHDELASAGIRVPDHAVSCIHEALPRFFVEACLEWPLDQSSADAVWAVIPDDAEARSVWAAHGGRRSDTLGRLLNCWCDPSSVLHSGLGDLFLEFDCGRAVLEPIVIARVNGAASVKRTTVHDFVATVSGGRLPEPQARWLDRVLSLPGDVRNVCWLGARGTPLLRVVATVNTLGAVRWLKKLHSTESFEVVDELLNTVSFFAPVVGLQLDAIQHGTVGVEILLPREIAENRWHRPLVDALLGKGLIDHRKQVALENWLLNSDRRLFRHLLIKSQVRQGQLVKAKAYLGFSPSCGS